jgi:hypothetical protein
MSRTVYAIAFVTLMTWLAPTSSSAAAGGVQWTPDGLRILANKDVGSERWAITLNLFDGSVTGNVFFTNGQPPSFIFCEKIGHTHQPDIAKLTLQYRCFGSDSAFGVFALSDWNFISDQVALDATFFAPEPETCDLTGALNGANAQNANSFWDCSGTDGQFQFQVFGDGTGVSSAIGAFTFDVVANGCGFGHVSGGGFFNVAYSPTRQILTLYETNANVDQFGLNECHRAVF